MENYHEDELCIIDTVSNILNAQREVEKKCNSCKVENILSPVSKCTKNTIPFILYDKGEALKVDGVTTYYDDDSKKEKYVCFTTYIFRVKHVKGNCAKLELLKFINHDKCTSTESNHVCSPHCQLDCEDVDDLISTGVYITIDLSCYCGILCLPAVWL